MKEDARKHPGRLLISTKEHSATHANPCAARHNASKYSLDSFTCIHSLDHDQGIAGVLS